MLDHLDRKLQKFEQGDNQDDGDGDIVIRGFRVEEELSRRTRWEKTKAVLYDTLVRNRPRSPEPSADELRIIIRQWKDKKKEPGD
jgi:hypothetical protein